MREFRRDRIALLERIEGDIGAFHLGPKRVIVISSPAMAREILVEKAEVFEKGPVMRRFARPILGDGLLAVDNASHKRRRRLVAPAFQPRAVESYDRIINEEASRVQLAGEVDLAEEMTRLTLRIIGRILFSIDLTRDAAELAKAFTVVLRHVSDLIEAPLPLPSLRARRAIGYLRKSLRRLIDERRRSPGEDVLSHLVQSRDGDQILSDAEILDEMMNLFVAGHETVANALAWSWALIATHGGGDNVLKEAMRLYPPVHSLGRAPSRPIEIGGYLIKRGEPLVISTWLMHRRADLFPQPLRFDPGREFPRDCYLPFGAGPRVCIGAQLALNEGQIILQTLARRFRFELIGSFPEPEMLVTLRPKHGVPARVYSLD